MVLSLAACGQAANGSTGTDSTAAPSGDRTTEPTAPPAATTGKDETTAAAPESSTPTHTGKRTLVVYFSWSGAGNTERMANTIKDRTGADILRIEPSVAYPTDYSKCGEVAKVERDENARPGIANLPASIAEYDTIFVGYPIWWHTAPMIIGTFLESFDLGGKDIYPFTQSAAMDNTHFENSMAFVRECAKSAVVHDGLYVSASNTGAILDYLERNGF